MMVFGGYTPSVNSISGAKYNAEPDTYSSPALQSSTGISVSPSSSDGAKGGSTKEQAYEPTSIGTSEPANAEPANTVNVPLPTFDESGKATGFKDNEVEIPQEQQHLDLSKLDLTPTVTHVYQHEDGSVGWEPDNRGTIDNLGSNKKTPTQKMEESARQMDNVYRPMGDDYDVDAAFAAAQYGTGEDQAAASIAGSSNGGGQGKNSNVNDAIFGGQSNRATPGYSLW